MPKFILTSNLNKLAKWLRFLGYDSICLKNISWPAINRIAQKENRIILTTDKKNANLKKNIYHSIHIKSKELNSQLNEIKNLLDFSEQKILSRCSLCNYKLKITDNINTISRLAPKNMINKNDIFFICFRCGKIYWKGDQAKQISFRLKKILNDNN